ncbi:MAG: anaerobic sulfatase maturase [Chloroflexi bacterium]|nr:anaerobic sulfatase maturase [Chloroflexota bacterium]
MTLQSTPPAAFHVMVKPRGPICNLSCAYCYYLPKSRLYPDSQFKMDDRTLEAFTRQYIEAQRVPEVTFGWQGGEPTLMGIDFFRRAVELQELYRPPGMRVLNALQTNGVLIDDEWAEFFRKHRFLIGLSLDGPRALHDAYRRDQADRPSFDRVMAGLSALQRHHVEYNILTTVHAANADHPLEVYRFLRDEVNAPFIQFIPIVRRANVSGNQQGTALASTSVTAGQYGDFLTTVFDEWVRVDVGRVFVQIFDVALAAWAGHRPGLCVFESTCGTAMVLEHNGDLYACDHFVEPRFLIGNILETPLLELVGSPRQRQFGLAKSDTLPRQCRNCEVQFVCHGGCPKNRILIPPGEEYPINILCEGYQQFFTHIRHAMDLMVEELRAQRPPAGVMARLLQEDAVLQQRFRLARRNDPCPCGSGRKYKHCHGQR